ncbi:MAG: alpha,alpha-trehalase, partial [Bacteroidales bacterium]|nr:alpha,alpha-trehalase [Bacteroidales bacterium]
LNYYKDDKRSFLACDASAWQYLEYVNMAIIAEKLGYNDDAAVYTKKAADLKDAMLRILWCEDDGMFYNVNRETGDWYKRVSYSCFVPLYAGIPSKNQASRMVEGYLFSEEHMLSPNGLRTLSKQDPDYNNINMISPFSNWQGPVWPIATFIYCTGLKNYGYDAEVRLLAFKMGERLIRDYEEYGSLHECYNAETGAALSPADTYVDKDGRFVGFVSWNLCTEMLLAL